METRQLLIEVESVRFEKDKIQQIRESNNGKLVLPVQLQRADALNANNRVYPKQVLMREVEKYQQLISARNSVGELDHPDQATVSLQNVSHVITEAKWEGNNLMGKVEVLDTPMGMILQNLVEAGVLIGVSSRAVGSTVRNAKGYDEVGEDLQIICWDVVSTPSTPGSWFMTEGKQFIDPKVDKYLRFLASAQNYVQRYNETVLR